MSSVQRVWIVVALLDTLCAVQANAQSAADIQAQIQRYGCHLPQYAESVAGCRDLHAKLRSLGAGNMPVAQSPKPTQSPVPPRQMPQTVSTPPRDTYQPRNWTPPQSRPEPQQPRGFFGFLFGPVEQPRHSTPYGHGGGADDYGFPRTGYGAYRTLCVRLCDGYFFPISYSTSRDRLGKDNRQCEAGCGGAQAKLFFHRTGGEVEEAVDLAGHRYVDLPNAFRHRKEYVSSCRCTPEPWSEEAAKEYKERETASIEELERAKLKQAQRSEERLVRPVSIQQQPRGWTPPPPRYDAQPRTESQRRGIFPLFRLFGN